MNFETFPSLEHEPKPRLLITDWINNKMYEHDKAAQLRISESKRILDQLGFTAFDSLKTPYAYHFITEVFESSDDTTRKLFQAKLRNGTVIDLGAGDCFRTLQLVYYMKEMGVNEHIAVEKFPEQDDEQWVENGRRTLADLDLKGDFIVDDMLLFLAKLPDNSANFIINGIDKTILRDDSYINKVNQELYRTTYDNGVIIGYWSSLYPSGFKDKFRPKLGLYMLEKK